MEVWYFASGDTRPLCVSLAHELEVVEVISLCHKRRTAFLSKVGFLYVVSSFFFAGLLTLTTG